MKKAKITALTLVLVLAAASIGVCAANGANYRITNAETLAAALEHAGLSENEVTVKKATSHEVEFIYGDKEYEYEFDRTTGAIKDIDIETVKSYRNTTTAATAAPTAAPAAEYTSEYTLTAIDALEIAIDTAGITDEAAITEVDVQKKNGYYKVEIDTATVEYEYRINAQTGEITVR